MAWRWSRSSKLRSVAQPIGATSYTYDAARNRIEQKDPKGKVVKMTYDRPSRLEFMYQDPTGLNLKTEHRYDPNGNETTLMDPKGQTVSMVYDELNRLKTKAYGFAPSDSSRPWRHTTGVTYDYDENGNLKQVDESVVTGTSPAQTLRTTRT